MVFFAFALLFFVYNIIYRSQVGRAFKAIKCDREVALILGVPAVRYKLLAFVLSSIYAGFSSGMLLILNKVITWESYGLNTSMDLLTADLIGGTGGVFGSVIGGAFISLQPTLTNFLAAHIHNGQNLTSAIFGVSLIVFVIFFPLGISGELLKKFKSRQVVRRGRFQGVPPPDYDVLEPRKQYFQPK